MKTLLLLLIPISGLCQSFAQLGVSGLLSAAAGVPAAVIDGDKFWPQQTKRAFPMYKLSEETSNMKYRNGDPNQGPAYFGATNFLVWTTDPWHRTQMYRNATMAASAAIYVPAVGGWKWGRHKNWYEYFGPEKKWYHYGAEILYHWAMFNVGKEMTIRYIKSK